ncbi:MAG: hypothetical protein HFI30_02065 [Lachnospiraceae bacterium]|jgi:hypothetical protein|nr:hypothetical protein [Lachnospiraceae bacterium]
MEKTYSFNAMHTEGEFGELLSAEGNEELKEFLENLFWIYASDRKDAFRLGQKAWRVKAYILKHLHSEPNKDQPDEQVPFGFTLDENTESTALFRLKAYIYYTRFCNLGIFLAENYYKSFPFSEEHKADDFRLALNYFMLNDRMGQCVHTGVAYKFNIDFLPRKESFYRFYDGIEDHMVQKLTVQGNKEVFSQIMERILGQIKGTDLRLYSVGKNFGQCLFKYFDPDGDWTFRIYEDVPINYIECNGRRYSIPAFLQIQETIQKMIQETSHSEKEKEEKGIDFVIDMSLFGKGRDGEETSSLNGFFKSIIKGEIPRETVATISDGEIVATQLPNCMEEYKISLPESIFLKKAYLDGAKDCVTYRVDLDRAEADKAKMAFPFWWAEEDVKLIREMKELENLSQIEKIMEKVNKLGNGISSEKNRPQDLVGLTPYCNKKDANTQFQRIKKYMEEGENCK